MNLHIAEAKKTLWFAWPFIINQILQMSVVTIDSIMAGSDSQLTLAAVAQGVILFHVIVLMVTGLLMPMIAMGAQAYGKNKISQLREVFQQAMWLALPLGLIAFVLMLMTPQIMVWVGVDEEIIPPATDYLRIIAFSLPLITLVLPMRFIIEAIGKPVAVMLITASSIPINIIGNYVLINGLLGFPKMGAAGIALSTVMAEVYFFVACLLFASKYRTMQPLGLFQGWSKPLWYMLKRIITLGIPNALALLMEVSLFAAVMLLAGKLGTSVAAASQVAFNYISNIFMIPLGISMALTVRIGMAMGGNDWTKARIIGITGILLGATAMSISMVAIFFFGSHIAELYIQEQAVVKLAASLLVIASFSQLFDGIQVCGAGCLRGLEETKAPMYYAIIGYWVLGVPIAIILAFPLGFGAQGLWWGVFVGMGVAGFLNLRKFMQITRRS